MFSPRIFLHSVLELITYEVVQFYKAAANQQSESANDGLGAPAQHNCSFPEALLSSST